MSTTLVQRTTRVRGGEGATFYIVRAGHYPAPYEVKVTWPNGRVQMIQPTGINCQNADDVAAYIRAYIIETVQSTDF